jgi:1-acyl-sn-glycerol-3-phosphate acyltransferase
MSSTESSPGSSRPSPSEPAPSPSPPSDDVYRGPEYGAAIGRGKVPAPDFEPLAHPDPYGPHWLYRFAIWVIRLIVYRLLRTTVEGVDNLPPPPYIIAANHQAWYDTAFILAALPTSPMVYTMARRDTVFNRRWKRWLVSRLGIFPIQPSAGELDERAVATVYQVLERGGNVLIFPEGRYSRGRALRPLKRGIAHFALQAGVPIVPVAVEGIDRLRLFGRVRISIGRPIRPDPPAWWELNRRLQRVIDQVRVGILRAFGRADQARRPGRWRGLFRGLLRRPNR